VVVTLIENHTGVTLGTDGAEPNVDIEIGIVTKGKPTLGMVLTSLLLQEAVRLRIHVVDTSSRPVITRDDVRFALRLAGDRGIRCSYEFIGESRRAFSTGKARIIRELCGPHLCLCDDDVVLPSIALARLVDAAQQSGVYGYICPVCVNAPNIAGDWSQRAPCTPGSLIYQDELVHQILLDYYESTTDVLDQEPVEEKVWEPAFLTTLFESLNRPAIRQTDTVIYHLDYHEGPYWIEEERTVIARSKNVARDLAHRTSNTLTSPAVPNHRAIALSQPYRTRPSWLARARRALHLPP
jgi:hypothetical protein